MLEKYAFFLLVVYTLFEKKSSSYTLNNEAVPSLVVSFYSQDNNNIFILNFARDEAIASLTFSQSTIIFISES